LGILNRDPVSAWTCGAGTYGAGRG
jgi:hypothetical protein